MPQPQSAFSPDVTALLRTAAAHHQRGEFNEAEALYTQVLARKPRNFDALHLYGVLMHQRGRPAEALKLIGKALRADAKAPAAHSNHGIVLAVLERYEDAVASYERAIALKPDYAEAHNNRGNALRSLRRTEQALESFARALTLRPDYAEAFNNRGNVLMDVGRLDEALASYAQALARRPDYVDALVNQGQCLAKLDRKDEALASFDRALALAPDRVDLMVLRGNIFYDLSRYDQALKAYQAAIAVAPSASALINAGVMLRYLGQPQDALDYVSRAIALAPEAAEAHWNKALLCLSLGDFAQGWPAFEWRWRGATELKPRGFAQPQWQGEDLTGKTILLHAEQGYGDSIQFLRYLPLVKATGAAVILELPDTLKPLLGQHAAGVTVINIDTAPPPFDLHCPLMSLAGAFGTMVDTIPADVPYLYAPPERVERLRPRLAGATRPRVGLVWSGKPSHKNDHNRSIPLADLAPLLAVPDVSFVSLQRDYREAELAALDQSSILRMNDGLTDFADTAAIIAQLDLVIAVDTAVAHLAGALGKPVWILLSHIQDWRWLLAREDSPWYPSARLFRQPRIGDWDGVIARLATALAGSVPAMVTSLRRDNLGAQ
jgi:tetratricopeptide (TPR) repeat protein